MDVLQQNNSTGSDVDMPNSENLMRSSKQRVAALKVAHGRVKASLAKLQAYKAGLAGKHPFDVKSGLKQDSLLKLHLRIKEYQNAPTGTFKEHLPLPAAVRPVVTS